MNKQLRQKRIAKVLEHAIIFDNRLDGGSEVEPALTIDPEPKYRYKAYQDCPNTMVELWPIGSYWEKRAFGFSKVNWPDPFDPDYGVELALAKAAAICRGNQVFHGHGVGIASGG